MLLVVRILLLALYFPLAALLGTLICLFRPFNPDNTRLCGRLFSVGGLRILGIKLEVEGLEHITDFEPGIVVANHQSNFDLFIHGGIVPKSTVSVGKKSLLFVPLFGLVYWLAGNIMIDRSRGRKSLEMLTTVAEAIREHSTSVWVFPEGTRNESKELLPFKKGAFLMAQKAGCRIYPICAGRYKGDMKLNSFQSQTVKLKVLPPIVVPEGVQGLDTLSNELRSHMQREIDYLS